MQEVYWGCFERMPDGLMSPITPERVSKPADVQLPKAWRGWGVGRGFAAYTLLQEKLADQLTIEFHGDLWAESFDLKRVPLTDRRH